MTKKQERARARRRWEKRQVVLAQRDKRRRQYQRNAAIVAVVLLVAAGLGWLGTQLLASRAAQEAKASASAVPSATPSTSVSMPPGCTPPPESLGTGAVLTLPDAATANAATWVATLTTNCGDIVMELDGAKAPQAVASFIQLAEADYWLNSPCHRLVVSDPMTILQCGDPTGTGQGTPGYGFGVENAPTDGIYPRGSVAMARTSDPVEGNGGQFFLVDEETTLSDPDGYTIFGTVTQGLDIVDTIVREGVAGDGTSATDGTPTVPISILRVAVTEKKA